MFLFYNWVLIYDSLCPKNGIKADNRNHPQGPKQTIPMGRNLV